MGVYGHSCSPSKVPTSTFLHGHTINSTGLDKISLFSAKEGGSKEGKCYTTDGSLFMRISFKSFSRRPSVVFCLSHVATYVARMLGKSTWLFSL